MFYFVIIFIFLKVDHYELGNFRAGAIVLKKMYYLNQIHILKHKK
jgi:hypothetical protein